MRFEGLTSWEAAKRYPYSNHAAAYNAIRRYESNRGLKPTDREPGAEIPLPGEAEESNGS